MIARLFVALIALVALAGCDDESQEGREVRLFVPKSCAAGVDRAYAAIYALGDFERPAFEFFPMREQRRFTSLPDAAAWIRVDGIAPGDQGPLRGLGPVSDTTTRVLLLRHGQDCTLTDVLEEKENARFSVNAQHVLWVGGRRTGVVPGTQTIDLSQGLVAKSAVGLAIPRASPAVAPFDRGHVVTGGSDPTTNAPLDSVEVFDAKTQDFEVSRISLATPRHHHAAVRMTNGDVLLVGGSNGQGLLVNSEVVENRTRRVRTAGLVQLQHARNDPQALLLASGEILVAGGTDGSGNPETALEWLAPDAASNARRSRELIGTAHRGFVALDAGGALAVLDAGETNLSNVWRITADGDLESLTRDPRILSPFVLFPGSGGRPLLFSKSTWYRFDPDESRFVVDTELARKGPMDSFTSFVSPDGMIGFLDASAKVHLFRERVSSPLDAPPLNLLVSSAEGFVLDRTVTPTNRVFDASGLSLGADVRATLVDLSFGDFSVELDTKSITLGVRPDDGGPPVKVGPSVCPWHSGRVRMVRRGSLLRVVDGDGKRLCEALTQPSRVRLFLEGPGTAKNLTVVRTTVPEPVGP